VVQSPRSATFGLSSSLPDTTRMAWFSKPWLPGSTGEEESVMASQPQAAGWLVEHGPKELESLFRAIVFQPSFPFC